MALSKIRQDLEKTCYILEQTTKIFEKKLLQVYTCTIELIKDVTIYFYLWMLTES